MGHRTFLLLCIFILLAVSRIEADERNLLKNSTFEDLSHWRLDDRSHCFEATSIGGRPVLRYTHHEGDRVSHADQIVRLNPDTLYQARVRISNGNTTLKPALRICDTKWQTLLYVEADAPEATDNSVPEPQTISAYFYSEKPQEVRFQLFGAGRDYRTEVERAGQVLFSAPLLFEAGQDHMREFLDGTLTVDTENTIEPVDRKFFGVNSLFWITDDQARADGKIEKYLREMRCGLIRFPGGEVADNFHWKTNLLDDKRSFPYQEGASQLDFDEFIEWNRRIGSEAICVVNIESCFLHDNIEQGIQEAVDWVRYSNIEKKYGVKYWELGNETDLIGTRYPLSCQQYADAVARFSRAMKAVDPTIQIGALGPREPDAVSAFDRLTPAAQQQARTLTRNELRLKKHELQQRELSDMEQWWPTLTKTASKDFDFAIIHRYDSTRTSMPTMYAAPYALREIVERLDTYLAEATGRDIPIALTEWNCWKNCQMTPVDHALSIAEQAGNYLEGGIDMANFWPMRYPNGKSEQQFRSLLDYATNDPRPAYEVMKLMSTQISEAIVDTKCTSTHLYCIASRKNDGGQVTIFVINRLGNLTSSTNNTDDRVRLSINIPERQASRQYARATARALVASEDGQRFEETTIPVDKDGDDWVIALSPRSMTVIQVQ